MPACFNLEKPITFQQQQLESQSEDERGDHLDGNHNRIAGLLFINFFALKTALFWKSGVFAIYDICLYVRRYGGFDGNIFVRTIVTKT